MSFHLVMGSGEAMRRPGAIQNQTSPARTQPDPPEALFSALDGREMIVLGRRWRIAVFSVCELSGWRYVQLALEAPGHYMMLTLRVATGADIRELIPRLLGWLAHPTPSGEILEIS
jgi:hypothetical protein